MQYKLSNPDSSKPNIYVNQSNLNPRLQRTRDMGTTGSNPDACNPDICVIQLEWFSPNNKNVLPNPDKFMINELRNMLELYI